MARTAKHGGSSSIAPQERDSVYVRSSDVFWDTPFRLDLWKQIVDVTRGTKNIERHLRPKGHEHFWVRLGTALPGSNDKFIADAFCVREEKSDKEPLHWGLNIRTKPTSRPPAKIVAEDKRIGGKIGLAKFLSSTLSADSLPVGQYIIRFSVEEKAGWKCKLVPQDLKPVSPALAEIGRIVKLEEIGYRFTDGVLGISELAVIYMHRPKRWDISVQARGPMRIENNLRLPFCEEVLEFILARLFDRNQALQ